MRNSSFLLSSLRPLFSPFYPISPCGRLNSDILSFKWFSMENHFSCSFSHFTLENSLQRSFLWPLLWLKEFWDLLFAYLNWPKWFGYSILHLVSWTFTKPCSAHIRKTLCYYKRPKSHNIYQSCLHPEYTICPTHTYPNNLKLCRTVQTRN